MNSYTNINEKNAENFVGKEVEFNYGCMYGSEGGVVVGVRTNRFGTELIAFTEEGRTKTISGFTKIGIGVYLK